jgi:hypothetical protein
MVKFCKCKASKSQNLIICKTNEVNYDRVITSREIVTYISEGGQEFSSCMCKIQSITNICTCFKYSV